MTLPFGTLELLRKFMHVAGMLVPIYIVRWLEDHKNRLYGFMGLRSKMLGDWTGLDEWMDSLDCYDY